MRSAVSREALLADMQAQRAYEREQLAQRRARELQEELETCEEAERALAQELRAAEELLHRELLAQLRHDDKRPVREKRKGPRPPPAQPGTGVGRGWWGKHPPQAPDLTGQRYGALLVIERCVSTQHRHACWRCRCDCGQLRMMRGHRLRRPRTPFEHFCSRRCALYAQAKRETHEDQISVSEMHCAAE